MWSTPEISDLVNQVLSSAPFLFKEYFLAASLLISILLDLFVGKKTTFFFSAFALIGCGVWGLLDNNSTASIFNGNVLITPPGIFVNALLDIFSGIILLLAFADKDLEANSQGMGELAALIIAATIGAHFVVFGSSLLMIFVGLELMSLPSYVMVAYRVRKVDPAESSIKYALFGLFSTGIMIYGMSWLYGLTGTLNVFSEAFIAGLTNAPSTLSIFALTLTLAGFAFKISAVPFHFWTPDAYEGSSGPVAAWLAIVPKLAGLWLIYSFMNIFYLKTDAGEFFWPVINWKLVWGIIGAVTLTFGNLMALRQSNFRRLMGYSSIAHTGFLLFGIAIMDPQIVLFYSISYGVLTVGAFSIGIFIQNKLGLEYITQYGGLGKKWPIMGLCSIVIMIGFVGLPPTGGFVAKMLVYSSLWVNYLTGDSWNLLWLIVAVINTLISLVYYLKIPYYLFIKEADDKMFHPKLSNVTSMVTLVFAVLSIYIGLFPERLSQFISSLF